MPFSLCKLAKEILGAEPIPTTVKSMAFFTIIVLWVLIMCFVRFAGYYSSVGGFLTLNYENYAGYLPAAPDTVLFAVFGLGL